jgi:pimeloyl-[acyl-carrier protein] methyl ester esterase
MRWLLMRGLVRESRHWLDFPTYFTSHVRSPDERPTEVVLLDLPGFGTENDGAVPDTIGGFVDDCRRRLRERVGADEKLGLLAVSLGGMVALHWLARYPEDFRCGVVINSSLGDISPVWQRMRPSNWPAVLRAPFLSPLARERLLLSRTRHQGDLEADARRYAEIATQTPPKRAHAVAQLRAAIRAKSPESIAVPTWVLASVGDDLVSWRCSQAIADRLSLPLKLHSAEGELAAGHDLPLDQPAWVCEQVNELTASLRAS